MPPRRMDRWWVIGLAFVAAAGMVLIVLLSSGDQGVTGLIRSVSTLLPAA